MPAFLAPIGLNEFNENSPGVGFPMSAVNLQMFAIAGTLSSDFTSRFIIAVTISPSTKSTCGSSVNDHVPPEYE